MMEGGKRSPSLHLDLTNFENGGDSRYVLTSPRSLEACARLGVRPVDLLYKSYGEIREEKPGASSQEVSEMYEAHEMERMRKVRQCQELRKTLLESDRSQEHVLSSTASQVHRDPSTWNHRDPTTSNTHNHGEPAGQNPWNHRDPAIQNLRNHRDPTTQDTQNHQDLVIQDPRDHRDHRTKNPWDHQDNRTQNRGPSTHKLMHHQDTTTQNPWNQRDTTTSPDRWDYLEVRRSPNRLDPNTLASSPSHWDSYSLAISPNRWDPYSFPTSPNPTTSYRGEGEIRRSLSHGNLVSQEEQIRQLTRRMEKEVKVSVPYRDKKIAALMLLKHQEEEMAKQRKVQAQQAWDDLRSKEKVIREALSKHDWTDRPQNHRRSPRSSKLEWQLGAVRYLTAQNNKDWKTLTPEERILLKDGMKKVREDLQSKRQLQESKEKGIRETGGRLLEERMLQALKAKMIKDLQDKKNIQIKNEYEKLRHSRLKEVADNQVKAEELSKRMSMRQKERRFQDIYEQIQEERLKEIQDKASREEGMTIMAKLRAERQEKEQTDHKKLLLQISNQKTLQAKHSLGKSIQSKAERTRELNIVKEKAHQILKQKVDENEENYRKHIAHLIRIKDRKSDKLLKEKEATIEEGKKIARASFHIRDQIREQTKSRTFDQMALQAQLSASFMKSLP